MKTVCLDLIVQVYIYYKKKEWKKHTEICVNDK